MDNPVRLHKPLLSVESFGLVTYIYGSEENVRLNPFIGFDSMSFASPFSVIVAVYLERVICVEPRF